MVLAPKLHNFNDIGFLWITFEGCLLENVNISFWDRTIYKKKSPRWVLKEHQDLHAITSPVVFNCRIMYESSK